jgi:hypothetical protein
MGIGVEKLSGREVSLNRRKRREESVWREGGGRRSGP